MISISSQNPDESYSIYKRTWEWGWEWEWEWEREEREQWEQQEQREREWKQEREQWEREWKQEREQWERKSKKFMKPIQLPREEILDLDHRLGANLAPRSAGVSGVPILVIPITKRDGNRFLKLENMGVKNARNMIANIRRDNAEIKALNKRIEEKKSLMVVLMSGYQSFIITVAKMSEEANDPTKKLFSQPFFLEKYRYKLSLQVNMDGSGGSLSVFVHIMKGDFDSILKWPFMHRIAIKVKNQKEGDDIVHIVQPDSTGIQKPEVNQNITFGSRNFATYSELLTGGFVRDDSISIECEVLWN